MHRNVKVKTVSSRFRNCLDTRSLIDLEGLCLIRVTKTAGMSMYDLSLSGVLKPRKAPLLLS